MQVHITNRAPYARREWVLFGSKESTVHSYRPLPGGTFLNVARVNAPANFAGLVSPEDPPTTGFQVHPAVLDGMVRGGFTPWIDSNGHVISLNPEPVLVEDDPRFLCSLWRGRTADTICEMLVYLFHGSPVVHWELRITCESLATANKALDVKLVIGTGARALTFIHDHDDASSVYRPLKHLKTMPWLFGDAQSAVLRGVVMFYDQAMEQDSALPDTQTCLAQLSGPLMAMSFWSHWGIWKKINSGAFASQLPAERGYLNSRFWQDSFMHPNAGILGKRPADSGEQAEFGGWSHCTDVSAQSSELLWRKLCTAYREASRPTSYYEQDGSPVKAAQHPRWTVWSEETHWSGGVSPDRLGRSHGGSDASGWFGHDDQHQGGIFLVENYLLTGSVALRRIIEQRIENWLAALTLPSTHPGYATNDPGPGRAVGRFFLAIAQASRAVWSDALVRRAEKRFMECVYNGITTPNSRYGWKQRPAQGVIYGYTFIGPDPRTGFPTQETWAPWQDAILVQGLDAFLRVCGPSLSLVTQSALMEMIGEVGRSFVEYGYTPSGDVAVAYMPVPSGMPPSDYYNPAQASLYNGFNTWGLQGVGVVEQRVPGLAQRCAALRARYEGQARDTYQGTLLP